MGDLERIDRLANINLDKSGITDPMVVEYLIRLEDRISEIVLEIARLSRG